MTVFHSLVYTSMCCSSHMFALVWFLNDTSLVSVGVFLPGYVDSITYVKYNMLYATSCPLRTFALKNLFRVSSSTSCDVGVERDEGLCFRHLCRAYMQVMTCNILFFYRTHGSELPPPRSRAHYAIKQ